MVKRGVALLIALIMLCMCGFYRKDGETVLEALDRVLHSDFLSHNDNVFRDLTIDRALELNDDIEIQPNALAIELIKMIAAKNGHRKLIMALKTFLLRAALLPYGCGTPLAGAALPIL